jgi:hypothetical protein
MPVGAIIATGFQAALLEISVPSHMDTDRFFQASQPSPCCRPEWFGKPRFTWVSELKATSAFTAGNVRLIIKLELHGSRSFALNWRPPHHAEELNRSRLYRERRN